MHAQRSRAMCVFIRSPTAPPQPASPYSSFQELYEKFIPWDGVSPALFKISPRWKRLLLLNTRHLAATLTPRPPRAESNIPVSVFSSWFPRFTVAWTRNNRTARLWLLTHFTLGGVTSKIVSSIEPQQKTASRSHTCVKYTHTQHDSGLNKHLATPADRGSIVAAPRHWLSTTL